MLFFWCYNVYTRCYELTSDQMIGWSISTSINSILVSFWMYRRYLFSDTCFENKWTKMLKVIDYWITKFSPFKTEDHSSSIFFATFYIWKFEVLYQTSARLEVIVQPDSESTIHGHKLIRCWIHVIEIFVVVHHPDTTIVSGIQRRHDLNLLNLQRRDQSWRSSINLS